MPAVIAHSLIVTVKILLGAGCGLGVIAFLDYWRFSRRRGARP